MYLYDQNGRVSDLAGGKFARGIFNGGNPNPSVKSTPFGSGNNYTTSVDGVVQPASPLVGTAAITAPFSFSTGFLMNSAPSSSMAFCLANASGNNALGAFLVSSTSVQCVFNDGGTATVAATVASMLNKYTTLAGSAASSTSNIGYFNGVNVGSNTNSNTTAFANSFGCIGISNTSGALVDPIVNGFVYYGAIWKRSMTAAEMLQLHLDPYCFLIYPEDEMFATLVGSSVTPPPGPGPNFLTSLLPMMGVG
jgi:hypothetical protein